MTLSPPPSPIWPPTHAESGVGVGRSGNGNGVVPRRNINPTENILVSMATCGDGWHNYHHTFPWDYKNAELLDYKLNLSTLFIDLFSLIGWAYDLKTVPAELVAKRALRTGDGTRRTTAGAAVADTSTTAADTSMTAVADTSMAAVADTSMAAVADASTTAANVFGWTDDDLPDEDRQMALIFCKKNKSD